MQKEHGGKMTRKKWWKMGGFPSFLFPGPSCMPWEGPLGIISNFVQKDHSLTDGCKYLYIPVQTQSDRIREKKESTHRGVETLIPDYLQLSGSFAIIWYFRKSPKSPLADPLTTQGWGGDGPCQKAWLPLLGSRWHWRRGGLGSRCADAGRVPLP